MNKFITEVPLLGPPAFEKVFTYEEIRDSENRNITMLHSRHRLKRPLNVSFNSFNHIGVYVAPIALTQVMHQPLCVVISNEMKKCNLRLLQGVDSYVHILATLLDKNLLAYDTLVGVYPLAIAGAQIVTGLGKEVGYSFWVTNEGYHFSFELQGTRLEAPYTFERPHINGKKVIALYVE